MRDVTYGAIRQAYCALRELREGMVDAMMLDRFKSGQTTSYIIVRFSFIARSAIMAIPMKAIKHVEDLAWLSNGYFETSLFLCEAMIDGSFDKDPGREAAVMFLAHHAIELHMKAAIIAAGEQYPNTHELSMLQQQYSRLYPEHPFVPPPNIKELTYMEDDLFPESTKESRDNKLIKFSFAMEGVRNSSRREIGPA
jgi:HEPN domain-containing protein